MFYIDEQSTIHYENTKNDASTDTGSTSSVKIKATTSKPVSGKYSRLSLLLLFLFIAISIGICYAIGKATKNICLGFLCFIPCMIILGLLWYFVLKNI
jgi:hypothetical protein